MAIAPKERKSLLSSQARVQAPWVKVTIGKYTFGVFTKQTIQNNKDNKDFYLSYNVQYPNYIQSLNITKINGQVNQYSLKITYPVRPSDDPNFFEKVFSADSKDRKIIFSYGDASMPTYCYKDEEALITKIIPTFNLEQSSISYTISAVSTAIVGRVGNFTFVNSEPKIPSEEIKKVFLNPKYGLQKIFTGMNKANLDKLVCGGDKKVKLMTKTNISPLDYISYLVSCMITDSETTKSVVRDIYVLTLHDDTIYDQLYSSTVETNGPYFKVSKVTHSIEQADAYEVDIGYNTANIVLGFSTNDNETYSIYYNYANELYPEEYSMKLNNSGKWENIFAPTLTSGNNVFKTRAEDISWYTKLTKYPISATLKIQGLLRPATLMQYLRLNVIFPGGNKHIASGLYIVTAQTDDISGNGYTTTLTLTRVSGDTI